MLGKGGRVQVLRPNKEGDRRRKEAYFVMKKKKVKAAGAKADSLEALERTVEK